MGRQSWEAWYVAYALLGAAVAGLVPILLPLAVDRSGRAADVGFVMAAFSLGGLTAPLWGGLADRLRLHRSLLAGGLLVAGLSLAAFPFARGPGTWIGLALAGSVGVAAAATVANLFVVEAHPQTEWDERIGSLQAFYGTGQVAGLLLAGALSGLDVRLGLLVTGALPVVAALPGWFDTRTPPASAGPRPTLPHPDRYGEWAPGSPQRLFHHLNGAILRQSGAALVSPFGVFLALWVLSFGGAAASFALFPVWMQQSFGVAPRTSSLAFAVAAGLGLFLYSPAGRWSERFGAARVMRAALATRLLAFLALLGLGLGHEQVAARAVGALVAFALVVLAWSPLSVVGTALAARLSPIGEGAGTDSGVAGAGRRRRIMRAIAIVPGTKGALLVDRAQPGLRAPDEIKLQVLRVGICGTDREETAGGRALVPEGERDLVIGHEMLGRVTEVGPGVRRVRVGDLAVLTVRRGCGECVSCAMNRSDMCRTGRYRERGIWGLDGYQTELVVDREQYAVHVPSELVAVGVLVEPLSVAEKAIDEAVRLQMARLPDAQATPDWLFGRPCLVAGLGPIGLLAALALRLRGASVFGLDVVDADSARPAWLTAIGGQYVDGRRVLPEQLESALGPMDLILEATGIAGLAFELLDALAPNGAYVLTGIPGGNRPLEIPGAELVRRLVLGNQAMVGSVNAARDHYQMAVNDLSDAQLRFPGHAARLVTHCHPVADLATAFGDHPAGEIKSVIEWGAQ